MAELILALDVRGRNEALRLLDRLPALRWVKVGSVLFTAEGPSLVREILERGHQVFLDLKWHDIPNTVSGAVSAARALGMHMATVHTAGGGEMMRAAAQAAGGALSVVGVTVLTSHKTHSTDHTDDTDSRSIAEKSESSVSSVDETVERLARSAIDAGLAGVVCSPLEVERVRARIGPAPLIVVPGIRRPQDSRGDQARVAGPEEAARWGATHLVIGRPILAAPDPARALSEFLAAMG